MGMYTCVTTNISLNVLEVPRFVKPMVDKVVSVGETAVLECQSSGSPRPQLAWRKDGEPLAPPSATSSPPTTSCSSSSRWTTWTVGSTSAR